MCSCLVYTEKKEEQTSETRTERYDSKEQQVVANGYNNYIEAHGKPEYKEVESCCGSGILSVKIHAFKSLKAMQPHSLT